jgi:hypothetical protein
MGLEEPEGSVVKNAVYTLGVILITGAAVYLVLRFVPA